MGASPPSPVADWLIDEVLLHAYRPLIPDKNVWQWADAGNVYLDGKAAPVPGFYHSAKTSHVREFVETFTAAAWREDLVMKCSRSGFTEAALNIIRFMPRNAPGHALYAIDSDKQAKAVSKVRLQSTLEAAAGAEFPDDPDEAGIYTMFLRNMTVYMTGSYSPGIFREKWLRVAILDECEVVSEIDEEGSTLDLAESRLKSESGDGKLFAMSKPKKKGTAFHKRWCNGTRSVRLVPCPHCGTFQELTFFGESATDYMRPDQKPGDPPLADYPLAQRVGRVRFDHCKDLAGYWDKAAIGRDTYYECVAGCRIDFDAPFTAATLADPIVGPSFSAEVRQRLADGERLRVKHAMMISGRWLVTNPRPHPRRRSRHISDLYSLYDDLSLPELALMWIDAQGDIVAIAHFFNNNLGLTFTPKITTIDESLILELRADYGRGECPFVPDLVLLNFDTQQHYYAAIITAWLVDGTCAIIDWFDAIDDRDIVARFQRAIPLAPRLVHPQHELPASLPKYVQPQYGLGDAAGCKGRTDEVYDLCLKLPAKVYPSFGRGGLQVTTPISETFITWRFLPLPIYRFSDDTFKRGLYCDRIAHIREIKKAQAEGKDPVLFGLPPRLYAPRDADAKLTTELGGERQLPDGSWQDPAPGPNHLGDALKNGLVQYEWMLPRIQATKRVEAEARAKAAAASATPGAL
ncbi:MAG TPA: terminase gpA endonuclease subunit [Chthonomonadales bacterium]|nr:terminase gpA endonuclease subunit [Chthonomonadales bacterium]